jgi:glycerol-3-phosphate acyltransferase PlsX
MGGDYAPEAPVAAGAAFAREHPDVEICLVGRTADIERVLPGDAPSNLQIEHTDAVISGEDEPVRAVRRNQDASLVVAARMVREGRAAAMLSAGNTGALVAAGLLVVGRIPGIERPALAPVLPTFDGRGVLLLDAGATVDASAENIVQFAKMGAIYSKGVLGVDTPRVGLLNIGTEASKGNAVTKEAYELLQTSGLNFVGNVEAREILDGHCNVVVCDGFIGNVVLKTIEGVGLGLFSALRGAFMSSFSGKVAGAIAKPSLRGLRDRFDYAEYGGAPFLGVAGGCLKAHGSSNQRAWYKALEQAERFTRNQLLERLTAALQNKEDTR